MTTQGLELFEELRIRNDQDKKVFLQKKTFEDLANLIIFAQGKDKTSCAIRQHVSEKLRVIDKSWYRKLYSFILDIA